MQLLVFPGLPRRFSLNVRQLLSGVIVPSDFLLTIETLVSEKELYSAVVGVGQICRFVPYFIGHLDAVPLRTTLRVWAESLPPYWKSQIVDHFLFELDEVSRGFDEWATLTSQTRDKSRAEEQQQNLALRRDGLEDVSTVSAMFDGSNVEFELMRQDVAMRRLYEKYRIPYVTLSTRLYRTRQAFPHAWWVS
jgi:hypothetical protein